ncbi:MAG: hypothetical protein H0V09_07250, partial [Gemmatimonadetes bacterium]|nr:hypothetical protein [Gemmatimonadota bacterium]
MTASDAAGAGVTVDAPARLQLGLLDLRGDLDRVFGGVGVAIAEPRVVVECAPATRLEVTGPDADRAAGVARRFFEHHDLESSAAIRILRCIPRHVGLGSGTQLAL